ncbi:hypothetical protein Hanom_Chr08g00713981 [Helianthus anomalus]
MPPSNSPATAFKDPSTVGGADPLRYMLISISRSLLLIRFSNPNSSLLDRIPISDIIFE